MKIYTLVVGPIRTNCYLVEDEKNKEALVIDPGEAADKIFEAIKKLGLKPRYIVNTHGHFDHVNANGNLISKIKIPILIHENDQPALALTNSPPADRWLKDGDEIKTENLSFRVIHTPGHTPGGICLYSEKEKALFSGDTLFKGDYGRTDLPYSSEKDMLDSLKKLLKLPEDTRVYPGHGESTTIKEARQLLSEVL